MAEQKRFKRRVKSSATGLSRDRLPPDPEGENEQRSDRGVEMMAAYLAGGGADVQDALSDMLSDLMHMCDRHPKFGDFKEQYDRAATFYQEEIGLIGPYVGKF